MRDSGEEIGHLLLEVCATSRIEVLLVAPFVKAPVLERILGSISKDVKFTLVTRWRPVEIAQGVSDIDIWPMLKGRQGIALWIRPDLHAKYYRGDDDCLVGSANLTASALGWSYQPNFELLIRQGKPGKQLLEFEASLIRVATRVDDSIYRAMREAVRIVSDQMPKGMPVTVFPSKEGAEAADLAGRHSMEQWHPHMRNPADLYKVYTGQDGDIISSSQHAGRSDLGILCIPPSLPEESFNAVVGTMLLQMPLIRKLDEFVRVPQRFGAIKDLMSSLEVINPEEVSQTAIRWLRHFLPKRYLLSQPNYSEIFFRVE